MNKLFTTLALAAVTLTPAMALDFNNPVVDPRQGTVTALKTINVTFPNVDGELDINSANDIVLDVNGTTLHTSKSYDGNKLIVTIPEEQNSPGTYTLTLADAALCGFSADYSDMIDSPAMTFSWTIEGSGDQNAFEYQILEPTGEISALSVIKINFPRVSSLDINSRNDITVNFGGTTLASNKLADGRVLTVTLSEPATAPGEYNLVIAPYALSAYGEYHDASGEFPYLGDNESEISIPFNIMADGVDFSFTANPPSGTPLRSLAETELTFSGLDRVVVQNLINVNVGDQQLNDANFSVSNTGHDNKVKITFSPALTADAASTPVKITFPKYSLSGEKGATYDMNEEALELLYTLAPTVVYDLQLELSSPTKPNADGQISAEKQLTSFFFNVPVKGCKAGTLENNVTIKEVNGDYELTGTLRDALGLDSNRSYFSVDLSSQPTYNGEYVITVKKGSVGDEIWVANNNIGRSNDETELRFTLVDGLTHEHNNIEPLSVTPESGTFAEGRDLAKVTVTFADGIDAVAGASASLAGVDNTFLATAVFVKNADGSFSATFDTYPTEDGNYMMTVNAGVFGDAAYLADSTTGHGSVEITRNYLLDHSYNGIGAIDAEGGDAIFLNMQGVRIAKPTPGQPYIRIENGKAGRFL